MTKHKSLLVVASVATFGALLSAVFSADLLPGGQPPIHPWGGTATRVESDLTDDLEVQHALSCSAEDLYGFEATCSWSGAVGEDEIKIVSASREDDRDGSVERPRESGLAVFNWSDDSGPMWFPAPLPGGPSYIDSVDGDVIRLSRSHGSVFFFDVSKLAYTKTLKPYTQLDLEEGIFDYPFDDIPNQVVTAYWYKVIDGEWVRVVAGATERVRDDDRPVLGWAGLWLWRQTKGRDEWHPAPESPQAGLRIVAARGHLLTLESSDGRVFHFDVDQERYV